MRKICDKKEKIHKEGQKSPLEPGQASRGAVGPPAGRESWWGKAGAPQRGGVPNGVPGGSQTRRGKAGAPERRGLPGMKWRVSTSQAEAAPAAGQHEGSGGRARRNGGSARLGRGPLLWAQKCPS